MNRIIRIIVILLLVVYTISPVDLLPGPIDDIILWVIYFLKSRDQLASEN